VPRDALIGMKRDLTELETGERIISERLPGVRSVALGFWIGAGSRDEADARPPCHPLRLRGEVVSSVYT
jgi:hypothetical protein